MSAKSQTVRITIDLPMPIYMKLHERVIVLHETKREFVTCLVTRALENSNITRLSVSK